MKLETARAVARRAIVPFFFVHSTLRNFILFCHLPNPFSLVTTDHASGPTSSLCYPMKPQRRTSAPSACFLLSWEIPPSLSALTAPVMVDQFPEATTPRLSAMIPWPELFCCAYHGTPHVKPEHT